jgi:hypothetical protein
LVSGVCDGSRARVYIGAQRRNASNMGHAHVARPSQLQQPTIRCDSSVKDSVKRSVIMCNKKISSAQFHKPWRARIATSEEEKEEERACDTSLLTHLPSGSTPHLICWSIFLPTFHVGLNLAPTSYLRATKNLGCMSHGLTHIDEVLPWQCPCLRAFESWRERGRWRI